MHRCIAEVSKMSDINDAKQTKQDGIGRFRQARREVVVTNDENRMYSAASVRRYHDFLNYLTSSNMCIDTLNQQDLPVDSNQQRQTHELTQEETTKIAHPELRG